MLIVETIAKIRRLFREHRSIREISRELRLSRKVVRSQISPFGSQEQNSCFWTGRIFADCSDSRATA